MYRATYTMIQVSLNALEVVWYTCLYGTCKHCQGLYFCMELIFTDFVVNNLPEKIIGDKNINNDSYNRSSIIEVKSFGADR